MNDSTNKVAIIGGTGPQGKGLALRLALAGVSVVLGSRDPAKAEETALQLIATLAEQDCKA
ncbi:MAG: NAD(P)-binding domain-containing protein, partial [Gammaproteobacteria bacterium]|nr:NAD(P)-binding domain-containing protein [Gammaproteobacteria bacterium]